MAQVTEVRLIDDLDEGPADETVNFAIDGKTYEIDLSEKHAEKLREGLKLFIEASRRGGRAAVPTGPKRAVAGRTDDRERNQGIRAWAIRNGYTVSDRGRLPADLIEQYELNQGRDVPGSKSVVAEQQPKIVEPDPVMPVNDDQTWNGCSTQERLAVRAWLSGVVGVESSTWAKSPKGRNQMVQFCAKNDTEGARALAESK